MIFHEPAIISSTGLRVEEQSFSATEGALATALSIGGRILHMHGHDDINQGQISARVPKEAGHFLIKQVFSGFDEVTAGEIIRVPFRPDALAHKLAPPEIPLHQAIYEMHPKVNAIVHTHALNCVAFGALEAGLDPISHEGACFQGRHSIFKGTSHTVLEMETGREIARCLADNKAVFLRNHGVVVVGESIKEAVILATVLERACAVQMLVLGTGKPFHVSREADIKPKQDFIFGSIAIRSFWDYNVRKLKRMGET